MNVNQTLKRFFQTAVFSTAALMCCSTVWADANDPILPGPKARSEAEGLGIGSLISTAFMATPKKEDGSGGEVVVWGYRKNGHSGNYNWNGQYVGFESFWDPNQRKQPRLSTVKDFTDPNHPLGQQKVVRLFATAHNMYAMTEEGELWGWGDSLYGTAGCVTTGYETGTEVSNKHTDYYINMFNYKMPDGKTGKAPHYQSRPCPSFGTLTPTAQIKKKVVYIDGGEYNTIVITEDNQVYTWGRDYFAQTVMDPALAPTVNVYPGATGTDYAKRVPYNITHYFKDDDDDQETPVLVGGAYEGQYALTVDKKGKYSLWGWGRNRASEIKNATGGIDAPHNMVKTPHRMTQYDHIAKNIIYVNGGYQHTTVLLDDGRVFGSGMKGYLGVGATYPDCMPDAPANRVFNPVQIMGTGTGYPNVSRLITRYIGSVAVPEDDPNHIYHWGFRCDASVKTPNGGNGWGAYQQIYGDLPVKRQLSGELKSIGVVKEAILYLNTDNELYGIGYTDQGIINFCENFVLSWNQRPWLNLSPRDFEIYSMNWTRKREDGGMITGGRRIRYEDLIDVENSGHCDGTFPSSHPAYPGKTRNDVRRWTAYDDGRDGPVPTRPRNHGVYYQTPES